MTPKTDLEDRRGRIPKGLRPPAQGCEGRATLGVGPKVLSTPTGLWPSTAVDATTPLGLRIALTGFQGSSFLATLGFEAESLWDSFSDTLVGYAQVIRRPGSS